MVLCPRRRQVGVEEARVPLAGRLREEIEASAASSLAESETRRRSRASAGEMRPHVSHSLPQLGPSRRVGNFYQRHLAPLHLTVSREYRQPRMSSQHTDSYPLSRSFRLTSLSETNLTYHDLFILLSIRKKRKRTNYLGKVKTGCGESGLVEGRGWTLENSLKI